MLYVPNFNHGKFPKIYDRNEFYFVDFIDV